MRFSKRTEGRSLRDCLGARDREEEKVSQGEREPNKGGFTNKALHIGA